MTSIPRQQVALCRSKADTWQRQLNIAAERVRCSFDSSVSYVPFVLLMRQAEHAEHESASAAGLPQVATSNASNLQVTAIQKHCMPESLCC